MKIIRQIYTSDLSEIEKLLINQEKDFETFLNLGWNKKNIKNHFDKKNNFSLGYFDQRILLGILIGEKIPDFSKYNLEIHVMYVANNYRKNKIGTSILNSIEKNKKLSKISKIYLEVSEKNYQAINFYEKNSFVFSNFRHNYYKINNEIINAKCYFKTI